MRNCTLTIISAIRLGIQLDSNLRHFGYIPLSSLIRKLRKVGLLMMWYSGVPKNKSFESLCSVSDFGITSVA